MKTQRACARCIANSKFTSVVCTIPRHKTQKQLQAIKNTAGRIAVPLEKANFLSEVQEYENEYIKFLKHAITFTNPSSISTQEMWSKILLPNPKSQTTWRNLTGLIESFLILPLTSSSEQFFFMGNIKTDWRCALKEETVEALTRITIEGPDLKEWAAVQGANAIEHWYKQKNRRIEQSKRKPYEKRQSKNAHKSFYEKDICFFAEIPKPIEIDDDDDDDD